MGYHRAHHFSANNAHKLLLQWRQYNSNQKLIFPGKNGQALVTLKKSWKSLLELANIENFRWHDMRHHFASKLVMAGVDLNTVRELLGHSDIKMTLRYTHLAPEHKALAVEKLVDTNTFDETELSTEESNSEIFC